MGSPESALIEDKAAALGSPIFGKEALLSGEVRADEMRSKLRARCIDSLYFLAKSVLGFKDMTPSLHGWMANEIVKDTLRQLFLVPRGMFKSSLGSIAEPAHTLIKDLPRDVPDDLTKLPNCNARILLMNASEDLVCHFVHRIRRIWESNEMFQWLFPETIPDFRDTIWSGNEILIRRSADYPEPSIRAIGIKGKITGGHFNHIIWDDLIEREAAESETVMEKSINAFKTSISLFDDPERDIGRMYGTRWHHNDLYKEVMDNLPHNEATGHGFRVHTRSAFENNESIFPERFSNEYLHQLAKEQGPKIFALQYMNSPSDPSLQEFDPELLREYTLDPNSGVITFSAYNPASQQEEVCTTTASRMDRLGLVDPALGEKKKKPDKAAPAIVLTGTADVFGSMAIFVLFSWTGQIHVGKQLDKIYETNEAVSPRGWVIEPAAFQRSLKRWIEERNREEKHGYVNYIDVKVRTRQSKEDHMRGLLPFLAHRRIYVPAGSFEFVRQLTHAPYGRPIDLIDAFALGLTVWRNPGKIDAEAGDAYEEAQEEELREREIGRCGY